MNLKNFSVILLAGDEEKCHRLVPNSQDRTYFRAAVEAVAFGPTFREVIVVGGDTIPRDTHYRTLAPGKDAYENFVIGANHATGEYLLVIATDLPHITESAVLQFCHRVGKPQADIYLGFATLADCAAFNHTSSHHLPLAGEPVKSASVFLIRKSAVPKLQPWAKRLIPWRKLPMLIAFHLLGLKYFFKLVTSVVRKQNYLDQQTVETVIGKRTGITCRGILCPAELAVDDDTPPSGPA